jgi:ankyrin repeat protein
MQNFGISIKDTFHEKMKHINILFQFIKTGKNDQFIEYLSHIDKETIDLNTRDEQGNYLIFFAIMRNNKKIVKALIAFDVRLDILDSDGYGVL